ncbi:hypothetical protein, partial [Vibrio sp. CJQ_6]|uniref:hypothetical protein n=1 Tax=Vibrio sp. CJQ_6 TaxID=3367165 RepID=UPI00370BE83B
FLLQRLSHRGRGGHFSEINCRVKHFFQFIFASFSALKMTLLNYRFRFFRSFAVSARGHYRDRVHIGKRFFTFFLIF